MNAGATDDPLVLARSLTRRTAQLCAGLESGAADLYDLVTPTTAQLLHWWFGEDACQTRAFNFHAGQRQAILNTIVAHEVLGSHDLKNLYEQACAEALLAGDPDHTAVWFGEAAGLVGDIAPAAAIVQGMAAQAAKIIGAAAGQQQSSAG